MQTMITLQARHTFVVLKPRKSWLDGELLLGAPVEGPVFRKVWSMSPGSFVHEFRLHAAAEVTPELLALLREAFHRAQR